MPADWRTLAPATPRGGARARGAIERDTMRAMVYQIKNSSVLPQIAFIFARAVQKIRRLFSNRSRYKRAPRILQFRSRLVSNGSQKARSSRLAGNVRTERAATVARAE